MVSRSMPPSLPPPRAEEVIPRDLISWAVLRASRLRTTLGVDEGVEMVRAEATVGERSDCRARDDLATAGNLRNIVSMGYV